MKFRDALVVLPCALLAACGSDDDPSANAGNAAGRAGSGGGAGSGGRAGASGKAAGGGASGVNAGGAAGVAGTGGTAGSAGVAGSAGSSAGGGGNGGTAPSGGASGVAGASGAGGVVTAGSAGVGAGGKAGTTGSAGGTAGTAGSAGVGAGGNAGTTGAAGVGGGDDGTAGTAGIGGGVGGTAGTTASAGAGGGVVVDPLAALSDEFASAATSSSWTDLYPAKHSVLAIDTLREGFLTIVPIAQPFTGWYSEYEGPLYYKNVTGNFVVETSITLGTATDRTVTPTLQDSYAQGGFVIRDPSSAAHQQRWIMYNVGFQDNAVAREIKTTVPSGNGTGDSLSTLNLNNVAGAANQGRLRVCRLGSVLRFYHRHPGESGWIEETFRSTGTTPTRVLGNGPKPNRADNSALSFDRPDFAATLQIGLYVGNYAPPPQGVRGEFDYARFGSVVSVGDCTRDL